ncbi:putative starch synthase [Helianthus debilis subsp. tardiflorus]
MNNYHSFLIRYLCHIPGDVDVGDTHADKLEDDELTQVNLNKVPYNIVFVTSEASPYSKTGGLGDVCGSLPIALAARGHRGMVVSPRYLCGGPSDERFAGTVNLDCPTKVYCSGGVQEVDFFHEYRKGVDWVFVDHPCYHRPGNPYGDIYGAFGDNQVRSIIQCG